MPRLSFAAKKNFFVSAPPKIFVDLCWFMKYVAFSTEKFFFLTAADNMLVQKTQIGIAVVKAGGRSNWHLL